MAAAVVAAHNHVLRRWLRGESTDPVREVDDALNQVIGLFAGPAPAGPDGHGTTVVAFRTGSDLDAVLPALRRLMEGRLMEGGMADGRLAEGRRIDGHPAEGRSRADARGPAPGRSVRTGGARRRRCRRPAAG